MARAAASIMLHEPGPRASRAPPPQALLGTFLCVSFAVDCTEDTHHNKPFLKAEAGALLFIVFIFRREGTPSPEVSSPSFTPHSTTGLHVKLGFHFLH